MKSIMTNSSQQYSRKVSLLSQQTGKRKVLALVDDLKHRLWIKIKKEAGKSIILKEDSVSIWHE